MTPEPRCDEPAPTKMLIGYPFILTASAIAGVGGPAIWIAYGLAPAIATVAVCGVIIGALIWWVS